MTTALQQLETNKILYLPTLRHFWKNHVGEIRCSDGASVADRLCNADDLTLLNSDINSGEWRIL